MLVLLNKVSTFDINSEVSQILQITDLLSFYFST